MARPKNNNSSRKGGDIDPFSIPIDESRDTPYGNLTHMQQAFVIAYVNGGCLNITQSVIDSRVFVDGQGQDNRNSAAVQGNAWLRVPKIRWAIRHAVADVIEKAALDEDYVINRLMREADNFDDGTSGTRIRALETLGKFKDLQLWTDNVKVTDATLTDEDKDILERWKKGDRDDES